MSISLPRLGIDEDRSRLHLSNRAFVQQMKCLRQQRHMQRNEVADTEQGGKIDVLNPVRRCPIHGRKRIVGENSSPEAAEDLRSDAADLASPNDPNALAINVKTNETGQ